MVTDREKAAFEAGIKLGALYTSGSVPRIEATAGSMEKAIEESVSLSRPWRR